MKYPEIPDVRPEKGYVHRRCDKRHVWKDQEFHTLWGICPTCGQEATSTSYYDVPVDPEAIENIEIDET